MNATASIKSQPPLSNFDGRDCMNWPVGCYRSSSGPPIVVVVEKGEGFVVFSLGGAQSLRTVALTSLYYRVTGEVIVQFQS